MTQEQFNTIAKVIRNGAPALADELIGALQTVIVVYQKQAQELDELKQPKPADEGSNPPQEGGK